MIRTKSVDVEKINKKLKGVGWVIKKKFLNQFKVHLKIRRNKIKMPAFVPKALQTGNRNKNETLDGLLFSNSAYEE